MSQGDDKYLISQRSQVIPDPDISSWLIIWMGVIEMYGKRSENRISRFTCLFAFVYSLDGLGWGRGGGRVCGSRCSL
jgi:hypothetical protein